MRDSTLPSTTRRHDSWFVTMGGDAALAPNLYCFAHAGANAEHFLAWQKSLRGVVNVIAMCPPGHAHRYAEERCLDMPTLAASASAAIDEYQKSGPFMLFGHSFGGLLAYETCRRLKSPPKELIISGCSAPMFLPTQKVVDIAALEGVDFLNGVRYFGGIPAAVDGDEELERYIVQKMKQDFLIMSKYRYVEDPTLTSRITTINGMSDPHVSPRKVLEWARTTTGNTVHYEAPGDHFYFTRNPEVVTRLITSCAATHCGPTLNDIETLMI